MNKNKFNNCAPIAIFCFNRIDHLKTLIESLKANVDSDKSEVYFFIDNWKYEHDKEKVTKVKDYVKNITYFEKINIIERDFNYGLQKNITTGIKHVFKKHNKIIVLEDDLLLSQHFLDFMNKNLDFYESNKSVASIHGYCYPGINVEEDFFFLRGADCWGWGTWKNKWNIYQHSQKKLFTRLLFSPHKLYKFNFGLYGPYIKMLIDSCLGRNDSWAIKWYASAFLKNMYTLYPKNSYVFNTGLDNSGKHCNNTSDYDTKICDEYVRVGNIKIEENIEARKEFNKFFKNLAYNKFK